MVLALSGFRLQIAQELSVDVPADSLATVAVIIESPLATRAKLVEVISGCGCVRPVVVPTEFDPVGRVPIQLQVDGRYRYRDYTVGIQGVFEHNGGRFVTEVIPVHFHVKQWVNCEPALPEIVRMLVGERKQIKAKLLRENPEEVLRIVGKTAEGVSVQKSVDGKDDLITFDLSADKIGFSSRSIDLVSQDGKHVRFKILVSVEHPWVNVSALASGIATSGQPYVRGIELKKDAPLDLQIISIESSGEGFQVRSWSAYNGGFIVVLDAGPVGGHEGELIISIQSSGQKSEIRVPVAFTTL